MDDDYDDDEGPTDVYRDGKLHVQSRMCDTCIFRPGNLMHLREGRVEDMVASCLEQQGTIPCHKNIGPGAEGQAICKGFFDRYKHEVSLLSVAERLGYVEEVTLT